MRNNLKTKVLQAILIISLTFIYFKFKNIEKKIVKDVHQFITEVKNKEIAITSPQSKLKQEKKKNKVNILLEKKCHLSKSGDFVINKNNNQYMNLLNELTQEYTLDQVAPLKKRVNLRFYNLKNKIQVLSFIYERYKSIQAKPKVVLISFDKDGFPHAKENLPLVQKNYKYYFDKYYNQYKVDSIKIDLFKQKDGNTLNYSTLNHRVTNFSFISQKFNIDCSFESLSCSCQK